MKSVILLIAIPVILYTIYCGFFYVLQRSLLFPTKHLPQHNAQLIKNAGGNIIKLPFSQGQFELAYLPPLSHVVDKSPVIFMAHGNGNIMDNWANDMDLIRKSGFAVILVEYPGYGRSQGKPSYQSIKETIALAYTWVLSQSYFDSEKITLVGRSMGGGAVLSLFDGYFSDGKSVAQPNAIVLMSTYSSIADLASDRWLPSSFIKDPFDNVKALSQFEGRSYLIHGNKDKTVPFKSLDRLLKVAKNAQHKVYSGGHNDVPQDWDKFWQEVLDFISESKAG